MAIISFGRSAGGKAASFLFQGRPELTRKRVEKALPHELWDQAEQCLWLLSAAMTFGDLRVPPALRPEHLKGDLKGWSSIRINQQFRIVFKWNEKKAEASDVYIVDYHS